MGKTKILIAEPDEAFRAAIGSALLRVGGFELVGCTGDGARAETLMKEKMPEVVLSELFLSGKDGFSLLERAKEWPLSRRPKMIMMSGFVGGHIVRAAEQAGASYYIQKPCEPAVVASRVKMLVASARAAVAAGDPRDPRDTNEQRELAAFEQRVTDIIREIGVPAHIKGYQYLRDAILKTVRNMDLINAVTKELYPAVAKQFGTTPCRVERAIRHAIEVAWERGNAEALDRYFGGAFSNGRRKPTNSECIAAISDRLSVDSRAEVYLMTS